MKKDYRGFDEISDLVELDLQPVVLGCCQAIIIMFAKILQNSQLSSQEQKDVLKSVIQVNLKQNLPEVKLQLTHNYEQLKPVLLKHWKYSLRIGFALFQWQAVRDFVEGRREGVVFDLIISIARECDLKTAGQYIVMELLKVYPDNWKCLVILYLASDIISKRINNLEDYNWFLAGFIKISASIIQGYLVTKNEPAKSNEDRIEKDLVLVERCEEWVTSAYLSLFPNLQSPKTQLQKQSVLSAFSSIIGALYESEREGHLNGQLLNRIQEGASSYLFRSYRIDEIRDIFINRLIELKYSNPTKKIEIPDKFSEKTHLQTEGICWILNRYLQESKEILSEQKQLDYSLLVFSEILPLPYKLKESLITNIHKLLQSTIPSPSFEISYPIGLLLFNIHQFQRSEFDSLAEKLAFNQDKIVKINRLKRLLSINIDPLNVEKTQFVVKNLDEDSLALKEALFLIKAVEFNFASVDLGKSVSDLFEKVSKSHGEQGRKIVLQILQRERQSKRNVELCHELSKVYSK